MTSVLAADLIRQGSTCSLCGNAFSNANPPTVSEVNEVLYGGVAVDKAICTLSPYIERHNNQSVIGLYYQSASNPRGFIVVIAKKQELFWFYYFYMSWGKI